MGKCRSVRVFVSSTFRDFGEERDLLVRKVFPILRAKLKDRFVELVDVDLRWGVTVEQAERGEVLPICLAEIDRSRPYFIGLLGERYGWVPGKEKYPSTLLRQRRWLKAHQGVTSVTELEILHGVLNAPEMAGRARFYFRSSAYAQKKRGEYLPISQDDRRRQRALKSRIRKSNFPVVLYDTPAELAKRLERDLWRILDAEFPVESIPDIFERESMRHEAYAASRRRLYFDGDGYLKKLKGLIGKNTPRILITGQSGSGKSALLANALVGMQFSKVYLFEHYLGASSDSADAVSLVRRLIDHIRGVTQSTDDVPTDPQALFESVPTWLAIASAYAQKTRIRWLVVLDALNKLSSYPDLRWFPSHLPPRVSIVVSCLEGDVRDALEAKGSWERMTIDPLDREGQERLLTTYLRRYNKTLPTDLKVRALEHPLSGNPLWLKTLAEELRLFGSHEELEKRLAALLGPPKGKAPKDPPTVDDLFEHVLARIEHDHGQKLIRNALTSIWASRAGLSEPELLNILTCSPAIWASIRYALDEMLLESGGRILFAHDYVKIAVRDRYLHSAASQRSSHRILATFFSGFSINGRVAEELPYQWREAGSWGKLKSTLLHPGMFWTLYNERPTEEHLGYWLSLEVARGKALLEQSLQRAWSRWKFPADNERSGDFADALSSFLQDAGRGVTGTFIVRLAEFALNTENFIYGADAPETNVRLNNLANLLLYRGDYAAAEPMLRRALEIAVKVYGDEHPATAVVLNNFARLLEIKGDYLAAEPLYRRVLNILEEAQGNNLSRIAVGLNNLANVLQAKGEFYAAEQLYRRALEIAENVHGAEHPVTGISLNNLGHLLYEKHDYGAAESLYRRALKLSEKMQGAHHPSTARGLNNLAALLKAKGDFTVAEPLYRRALGIAERVQGAEHPDTAAIINNFALFLYDQGDYSGAESLYQRALRIQEMALGSDHQDVMGTLAGLGETLFRLGRLGEAGDMLSRAVGIAEARNFGGPFYQLGCLRIEERDYFEAERLLRRCIEIRRAKLAPTDQNIRSAVDKLAEVLRLTGREADLDLYLSE